MKWPDDFIDKIISGDCLDVTRGMPGGSVDMCLTSPPYWGKRDYGVDGQYGLEENSESYIEKMTTVFSEVKRILKKDGTLWLNMGDTYSGHPSWNSRNLGNFEALKLMKGKKRKLSVPNKCLCMIPERLAWSLIQDGWILRNKNIWYKTNGMPEHEFKDHPLGKNPGDVWEIQTQPFQEAHFAVFPKKLCEKPIKAGCPEGGLVLDPFCGSGTALFMAAEMKKHFIGIDIKPEYCKMSEISTAQKVI